MKSEARIPSAAGARVDELEQYLNRLYDHGQWDHPAFLEYERLLLARPDHPRRLPDAATGASA